MREQELLVEINSKLVLWNTLNGTVYRDILTGVINELKIELYKLTGRGYQDYDGNEIKVAQMELEVLR